MERNQWLTKHPRSTPKKSWRQKLSTAMRRAKDLAEPWALKPTKGVGGLKSAMNYMPKISTKKILCSSLNDSGIFNSILMVSNQRNGTYHQSYRKHPEFEHVPMDHCAQ
jgi:hypothetical protein